MKEVLVQLSTAFIGVFGFSLIFQVRRKLLFWTSLGGMLSWGVCLLVSHFTDSIFIPYMLASITAALYAETMARLQKAPATTYLILALIPSIPGGALFYTMSNVVQKLWPQAIADGKRTIQYALAIAVGISIVWAVDRMVQKIKAYHKDKKAN